MKQILPVLICVCALSGCAIIRAEPWPDEGHGGLGEWQAITDSRANALSARLDLVRDRNAPYYAAAEFVEAERLMTRIRREIAGDLHVDAETDMNKLEIVISSIERRTAGQGRFRERARS